MYAVPTTGTIAAAAVAGRKRPRPSAASSNSSDIFLDLKQWILAQQHPAAADGTSAFFVHSKVEMRTDDRSLVVSEGGAIEKGATVFRIPAVKAPVQLDEEKELSCSSSLPSSDHDDAELAWYLAQRPSEMEAYLNSLPNTIDLPRFWSNDKLNRLLKGSPVLARIRRQQEALQRDYNRLVAAATAVQQQGKNHATNNHHICVPSMEDFSYAMAAVTSRAFCHGRCSVIVPLLDLCNHHRGKGSRPKNLSYTLSDQQSAQEDGSDTTTTSTSTVVVQVQAATDIAAGECLRITYGAQGNAQLLMNYGFCLEHNNLEPDGSSNDTLEFCSSSGDGTDIFLRTGPKAYTYGSFVKALELCSPPPPPQPQQHAIGVVAGKNEDNKNNDSAPDDGYGDDNDMEAFLNECDAEEEKYDEDEDVEEDEGCSLLLENSFADEKNDEERKAIELETLVRFRASLLERARAYNLQKDDIEKILETAEINSTPEFYAALLLKSELRIIHFYLLAIDGLENKLGQTQTKESTLLVRLEPSDSALIEKQVEELVAAYMQIRHSDFLDGVSHS